MRYDTPIGIRRNIHNRSFDHLHIVALPFPYFLKWPCPHTYNHAIIPSLTILPKHNLAKIQLKVVTGDSNLRIPGEVHFKSNSKTNTLLNLRSPSWLSTAKLRIICMRYIVRHMGISKYILTYLTRPTADAVHRTSEIKAKHKIRLIEIVLHKSTYPSFERWTTQRQYCLLFSPQAFPRPGMCLDLTKLYEWQMTDQRVSLDLACGLGCWTRSHQPDLV